MTDYYWVQMQQSGSQSGLTSGTKVKVNLPTVNFNPSSTTTDTTNSWMQVPINGVYLIHARIFWTSGSGTQQNIYIQSFTGASPTVATDPILCGNVSYFTATNGLLDCMCLVSLTSSTKIYSAAIITGSGGLGIGNAGLAFEYPILDLQLMGL